MKLLLVASPGVAALVLAIIALGRDAEPSARADIPAPAVGTTRGELPSFRELYERVDGVVARVDARRGPDDPPFGNGRRDAIGAGFVVDARGHMVTNAHVVDDARSVTVRFGRTARRVTAEIVGVDRATDLAVLRVDPRRLGADAPLELAPAGSVRVGDPVLAVGTPYRLQSSAAAGIVSAVGREIRGLTGFSIPDAVQTDAAINPGNSGGPLVDERGRVVGVNSQGRAAGVSFAVSAVTMRRVVPQLIEDGRADQAVLGVSVGSVTDRGARIASVTAGGPADRAGLRDGDVIARIGDRPTTVEGAVASAVAARRPGQRVPVQVLRDGRERTVTVRLGRR
ncbi:S1C family serine protease [Paraconexibacter algicola]|uniref:Peptidase S1 n=1 Tax=Paraconexibacter algicola TaxID=2133960 RepID=A0A2T4UL39_9ACTN|nr:trypsin-like peptidase domain-containing protein [Paraconexibacter algicola]PTL59964.1 peptidase S1 [Paraconexibacter algicola]